MQRNPKAPKVHLQAKHAYHIFVLFCSAESAGVPRARKVVGHMSCSAPFKAPASPGRAPAGNSKRARSRGGLDQPLRDRRMGPGPGEARAGGGRRKGGWGGQGHVARHSHGTSALASLRQSSYEFPSFRSCAN